MTIRSASFKDQFTGALEWWDVAGVDLDLGDSAIDWLEENRKTAAPTPGFDPDANRVAETADKNDARATDTDQVPQPDLLGDAPPPDLASFQSWWMSDPQLDSRPPETRIAPRGSKGARLMICVLDPEAGDKARLLDGPQGAMLSRFLGAAGLDEKEVYFASVLPRHTPMADPTALVRAGFGSVLLHHIALVKPVRLLGFGSNLLPLLGHDAAQGQHSLRQINHKEGTVECMVSEGLESLLSVPRLKRKFWRNWLEWTEG